MVMTAPPRASGRGRQSTEVELARDVSEEFTAHLAESADFVRFVREKVGLVVDMALAGSRMGVINHAQALGLEADRRLEQLDRLAS